MRSAWPLTAIVLAIVVAGSYGFYVYVSPSPLPHDLLYGNGQVEGTEVRVSSEVTALVAESRLVEGTSVSRGDTLVVLDDTDLQLQRQQAEAAIEELRQEKLEAQAQLGIWHHHLEVAQTELDRYQQLHEDETASLQRLEQAENAFKEAQGRAAAAEATVAAIGARIVSAQSSLDLTLHRIEKTRIVSPIDGTVLTKAVEPGELVTSGQLVAVLVDLSDVELRLFIAEQDIGKVRLGAPARVKVDAFPDTFFEGRVARVDQEAQFTPRDIHMPDERVRLMFGVNLALDNPGELLKPGLPADAWILWPQGASWPNDLIVPQ